MAAVTSEGANVREVGHKEAEAQLLSARQNAHNTPPAPKVSCFGVKIKFSQ